MRAHFHHDAESCLSDRSRFVFASAKSGDTSGRAHNRLWAEERFGKEHVASCIALRHRKWDRDAADLVLRGLENLGFKTRDATHAIADVAKAHANDATPLPKESILREALSLLT